MRGSWKIKEILNICSRSKRLERGDNGEETLVLDWVFWCEGHCWNIWRNLKPVPGHRECRLSVCCSCNFSVMLKCVMSPPHPHQSHFLSPFLVHQVFEFRTHSWAQSAILPQRLELRKPSQMFVEDRGGGGGGRERGREGEERREARPKQTCYLLCQAVQLA